MAFDWREFLTLARELAQRSEEAALRTAISRAYYAAYGTARDRLAREDALPFEAGQYLPLWDAYRMADEGPRYYIGLDGQRLRRIRNEAEVADLPARAQRAVRDAERILNALERLPE